MAEAKIKGFQDIEPEWLADWSKKFVKDLTDEKTDELFASFVKRAEEDESFRPFYAMWRFAVEHHGEHHKLDDFADLIGASSNGLRRSMQALGMKEIPALAASIMTTLLRGVESGKTKEQMLEELKVLQQQGVEGMRKGMN